MKKIFTLFFALAASVEIMLGVKVGELYYNLNETNKTAEVTYKSLDNNYTFITISIPASITYGNKTYSVTSIDYQAFKGCSSLTSVTIPNSVTSIEANTFGGCSSLTSVTIPNSVTSIGEKAFYYCVSLTSVTIPNRVTSIAKGCFEDCSSLTSVTIPNGVTNIGERAFYGCENLTSVTIPNGVTTIQSRAFMGCVSITSITCKVLNPPSVGEATFVGVNRYIPLYVPAESVNLYKNHATWGILFANIRGIGTMPNYEHLYEIGDNQNWNPERGIEINKKANNIFEGTFAFSNNGDSYFGFITELSGNWDYVNQHRFGPASDGVVANIGDNDLHENMGNTNAFKISSGVYKFTVNLNEMKLTVAPATGIESIDGENNVMKVLEGGKLYILLPDGTKYSATGKKVE